MLKQHLDEVKRSNVKIERKNTREKWSKDRLKGEA